MNCTKCGKRIRKDAGDCPYCGAPIELEDVKAVEKKKVETPAVKTEAKPKAVKKPKAADQAQPVDTAPETPAPAEAAQTSGDAATPLTCPVCGHSMAAGMAFCNQCGAALAVAPAPAAEAALAVEPAPVLSEQPAKPESPSVCPRCGNAVTAEMAFCRQCGMSLAVAASQPEPVPAPAQSAQAVTASVQGGSAPSPSPVQDTQSEPTRAAAAVATATAPVRICPQCGGQNTADTTFCNQCGMSLMQQIVPAEIAGSTEKPRKNKTPLLIAAAALVLVVGTLLGFQIVKSSRYNKAAGLLDAGQYAEAQTMFVDLGGYKDAADQALACQNHMDYDAAAALMKQGKYEQAEKAFRALGSFSDAKNRADECRGTYNYLFGESAFENGEYEAAMDFFVAAGAYKDAAQRADTCQNHLDYNAAQAYYNNGQYYEAYVIFGALGDFGDSAERMAQCVQTIPSTGRIYSNPDVPGSSSQFQYKNNDYYRYIKIYTVDGVLARTGFVRPNSTVTFSLPPGTYRFNIATFSGSGDVLWFGETDMFGPNGYYQKILDSDNVTDTFEIPYNMILEFSTGAATVDDALYNKSTDRESF